jgi:hypothetical protein
MRKIYILSLTFVICILTFSSATAGSREPLNPARVPGAPVTDDPRCMKTAKDGTCESYALSIYELIVNGEKYHDKIVAIGGYVRFEFEGNAIYATKEHYLHSMCRDAIWLDVQGLDIGKYPNFREGYAYVRGRFDRFDGGHFRVFPGALKGIDFFQPTKFRKARPPNK